LNPDREPAAPLARGANESKLRKCDINYLEGVSQLKQDAQFKNISISDSNRIHHESTLSQKSAAKKRIAILIVDDDPHVLGFLVEFLRDTDYQVVTASSGENAIESMRTMQFDIALVDFKMPDMDGLETIERITNIDPELVSILMTGFPTLDSSIKAIRLGASDYLLKPFNLDEVNLAIKRALDERGMRREATSLREKIARLENGVSHKKGDIRFNKKVNSIAPPFGQARAEGGKSD
jgi:ActR/RegA family two-component response regulator